MLKTFLFTVLIAASANLLTAQKTAVYASGLKNPTKVILTSTGSLLVTDVDSTANSGRLVRIMAGGVVKALITGLPSGLSAPNGEADGPSGIVQAGNVLYIGMGEGDGFAAGAAPGQLVANPKGPSSPIFAAVLQVTLSTTVDQINGTFALTAQDQSNLSLGQTVTESDGSGATAVFAMTTQFRPGIPDANTIYRNSHPYGITNVASQPNNLYVADAGRNVVWKVDSTTGKSSALAQFAPTPNPVAGPPVIEAVPNNIRAYGDQLLVTLLSGAPFVAGQSRVIAVDPATGAQSLFIYGLNSATDVAFVPVANARPIFYVLQYSSSLTTGAAGQLLRYDTPVGRVYVDNLKGPTSMAVDAGTGAVYVAEHNGGDILIVTPQ